MHVLALMPRTAAYCSGYVCTCCTCWSSHAQFHHAHQEWCTPIAAGVAAAAAAGDNLAAHRQDADDPDVWDETVSMDQIVYCAEIAVGGNACTRQLLDAFP